MRFLASKTFRYGFPFFMLVIGGSFGLREFTSLKYEFGRGHQRKWLKEVAERSGISLRDPSESTLEAQYEKIKELDTENWENIRGPRPWEEGNVLYAEAVARGKKALSKDSKS